MNHRHLRFAWLIQFPHIMESILCYLAHAHSSMLTPHAKAFSINGAISHKYSPTLHTRSYSSEVENGMAIQINHTPAHYNYTYFDSQPRQKSARSSRRSWTGLVAVTAVLALSRGQQRGRTEIDRLPHLRTPCHVSMVQKRALYCSSSSREITNFFSLNGL